MLRFFQDWWRVMGWWRWLNLLPLIVIAYFAVQFRYVPDDWTNHGARMLGTVEATLYTRGKVSPGSPVKTRIELSSPLSIAVMVKDSPQAPLTNKPDEQELEFRIPIPDETRFLTLVASTADSSTNAEWSIGSLYP